MVYGTERLGTLLCGVELVELPPNMIKGYDVKTDFFVNYFPSLTAYEKFLMPFVGIKFEYAEVNEKVGDLGLNTN